MRRLLLHHPIEQAQTPVGSRDGVGAAIEESRVGLFEKLSDLLASGRDVSPHGFVSAGS